MQPHYLSTELPADEEALLAWLLLLDRAARAWPAGTPTARWERVERGWRTLKLVDLRQPWYWGDPWPGWQRA